MKKPNVKVGKTYDAYEDGKHSVSRLEVVMVDDVVPRSDLSLKARRMWRKALKDDFRDVFESCVHYMIKGGITKQFWDWNCDWFIVGHIVDDPETKKDPMLFARQSWGGWYCINWNYKLDVTGKVRRENVAMWKMAAEEQGRVMRYNRKTRKYDYYDKTTGVKVD